MILVIDHKDSFTGNLVHLLANFGEVQALQAPANKDCLGQGIHALVLSPGPGHPKDYPETLELYHAAKAQELPILGICLGFQLILHAEGAEIIRQSQVLHGVQTPVITVPGARTYRGLPKNLPAGRYHSLQANAQSFPKHIRTTAWDEAGKIPLSFEMESFPWVTGLQYHPDSFLTPQGQDILRNCFPWTT